ncbi:MAG: hypothetical protein E7339_01275 [Clostridiales bacterium]|nr:hypothetical protein [Clostridiales bacterium]
MIHSLCGGKLRDNQSYDVVKIKFINNPLAGERPYWYKSALPLLKEGDTVLAPFGSGEREYEATVLRIDKNVNEQCLPIPASKMGEISSIK